MERHILHWSYWLGIASLIIAFLWRALNAFGLGLAMLSRNQTNFALSFYKASLLLLVAAIASASYAEFRSHKT